MRATSAARHAPPLAAGVSRFRPAPAVARRAGALAICSLLALASCARIPATTDDRSDGASSLACRQVVPPDAIVRWVEPEGRQDRDSLARWCDTIGPVLLQPLASQAAVPASNRLAVLTWNVHVGSGNVIDLVRRLAVHYPDAQIAGILNRQTRSTATGLPFTAGRVQSLRHHWNIPCHQNDGATTGDQPLTIVDAAAELKLPPPTLHRWINEGFITGAQLTPGAPWRIRLTDQVRALFVDDAPDGWLPMLEATLAHGLSRKAIMKHIKSDDLQAVYVRTGQRKGLRIEPPTPEQALFQP